MQINTNYGVVKIENGYTKVVVEFPEAMPLEELSAYLKRYDVLVNPNNVESAAEAGRLIGRFYKRYMLAGFSA